MKEVLLIPEGMFEMCVVSEVSLLNNFNNVKNSCAASCFCRFFDE